MNICDVKMKLEFVGIPDDEDWGTADSLRHIGDKIKVNSTKGFFDFELVLHGHSLISLLSS